MASGGKREGAGRPVGATNKNGIELRELARSFGPAAIMRLAELAGFAVDADGVKIKGAESEAAQVAATNSLLDRGYGKAVQPQSGPDGESNPVVEVVYRWSAAAVDE